MVDRQMLVKDLEKVLSLFKPWGRQNDSMDRETRFIYDCNTYSDLEARITAEGLDAANKNYAYHRWFNFKTSKEAEGIFLKNGCIKSGNPKSHKIDFFIPDYKGQKISCDLKLTVFPKRFDFSESVISKDDPASLMTRMARNELARWYYGNQSPEGRYHVANRLFLVGLPYWASGETPPAGEFDDQRIKYDFQAIEDVVPKFLEYHKNRPLNRIDLGGVPKYSDVIFIRGSKNGTGTVCTAPTQGSAQDNVA